jgi:NMD protein affecting ribosome stability and mRNA decay
MVDLRDKCIVCNRPVDDMRHHGMCESCWRLDQVLIEAIDRVGAQLKEDDASRRLP